MASKFFKAFKFFKGKVSPTIKSVKPTKDISGSVKRVYRDETSKRIDAVSKTQKKMDTGRKMMREAKKEQKNLVDTGRAFQFKHSKGIHAIRPGENPKKQYKGLLKEDKPQKKFKKGKELDREKKMGGGMMGRRMGYSQGSNGKPVSRSKNPGLLKMSKSEKGKAVVKKFGYNPNRIVAKKGGKA
jgi:hypothetical protein